MMAGGGEDHDRAPAAMGAILVRGFVIAIRRGSFEFGLILCRAGRELFLV